MQPSFLQSYLNAFGRIEGWFSFDAALLFMAYNQIIRRHRIAGDVLEIGVHHGLSSIAVASLRGSGGRFYAVDLFEGMQDQNVSRSGEGNRAIFDQNMREFYPDTSFIKVITGASTQFGAAELGNAFSFCHIDGGHSRTETLHDLILCHSLLLPGGLIALDDYFNPLYPGVGEGAVQFMLEHAACCRPVAIAYNKVILQKLPAAFDLNEELRKMLPAIEYKTVQMWDGPAMLIASVLRTLIDLHASSPEQFAKSGEMRRASLEPARTQFEAKAGKEFAIPVIVTNTSEEIFPAGKGVFGLSWHLLSASGEVLRHDNDRTWLTTALKPRDSKTISLSVQAPPQAGRYKLEIDLVWEKVMWFKDVGNPTTVVDLTVR